MAFYGHAMFLLTSYTAFAPDALLRIAEEKEAEEEEDGMRVDSDAEDDRAARRESVSSAFGVKKEGSNMMYIKAVAPDISRDDLKQVCARFPLAAVRFCLGYCF